MTDDNNGSLRGCTYLDHTEGIKHGFAKKYYQKLTKLAQLSFFSFPLF